MKDLISPIGGWILDSIVELDRYCPGFAGAYLRSSDERRQVIAAALATKPFCAAMSLEERADFLARSTHDEILRDTYARVPTRFRGALRRSGGQAHDPSFYTLLHALLSSPRHSPIPKIISRLPDLSLARLRIVERLPFELSSVSLVQAIEDPETVGHIITCVSLLTSTGVDRPDMVKALRAVETPRALADFWGTWVKRACLPAHPVPASENYFPVKTAGELASLGRRYRNCAERYLSTVLEGVDHFAEFEHAGRKIVLHLQQRDGAWCLEDMFGRMNCRPRPEVAEAAKSHLQGHGILPKQRRRSPETDWHVLRRLAQTPIFDLDDF